MKGGWGRGGPLHDVGFGLLFLVTRVASNPNIEDEREGVGCGLQGVGSGRTRVGLLFFIFSVFVFFI